MVEDNPGDVRLVQESLKETKIPIELQVAKNGQEALGVLGLLSNISASVKPDLVLLDLNLPVLNGNQVLRTMKQSSETRSIPVVVFSTSSADKDILESYDNFANCYVTKPSTLEGYLSVIPEIFSFWFNKAQLPPIEKDLCRG
jgi:CheY-like chemotaxis protein